MNKTTMKISQSNLTWLKDQRNWFQTVIDSGYWSLDDAITEIRKILPSPDDRKILHKGRWLKWETYKRKMDKNEL